MHTQPLQIGLISKTGFTGCAISRVTSFFVSIGLVNEYLKKYLMIKFNCINQRQILSQFHGSDIKAGKFKYKKSSCTTTGINV